MPTFYQNYIAMSNTADVTGGKPIADWSQSISDAINPLVAFYDIHGRKREVSFILSWTPHENTQYKNVLSTEIVQHTISTYSNILCN
jgi:hypothetical protein